MSFRTQSFNRIQHISWPCWKDYQEDDLLCFHVSVCKLPPDIPVTWGTSLSLSAQSCAVALLIAIKKPAGGCIWLECEMTPDYTTERHLAKSLLLKIPTMLWHLFITSNVYEYITKKLLCANGFHIPLFICINRLLFSSALESCSFTT